MTAQEQLKNMLSLKAYSLTKPRKEVFELLVKKDKPMTVAGIAGTLKNIDRASVYRTITLFEELGIAHRIWNGFKSRIELSEAFSPHHHHFTCNTCGAIIALDSERLENSLHELENDMGFRLTSHSVELRGECGGCI